MIIDANDADHYKNAGTYMKQEDIPCLERVPEPRVVVTEGAGAAVDLRCCNFIDGTHLMVITRMYWSSQCWVYQYLSLLLLTVGEVLWP